MRRSLIAGLLLALLAAVPVSAVPNKSFVDVTTPIVHVGETLSITTSNDGVLTCYGSVDGAVVWAYPFVGAHESYSVVIGYSQNWAANPVPLDGECVLYQVIGHRVRDVANDTFSLLP